LSISDVPERVTNPGAGETVGTGVALGAGVRVGVGVGVGVGVVFGDDVAGELVVGGGVNAVRSAL
jgi:hypothetical protein